MSELDRGRLSHDEAWNEAIHLAMEKQIGLNHIFQDVAERNGVPYEVAQEDYAYQPQDVRFGVEADIYENASRLLDEAREKTPKLYNELMLADGLRGELFTTLGQEKTLKLSVAIADEMIRIRREHYETPEESIGRALGRVRRDRIQEDISTETWGKLFTLRLAEMNVQDMLPPKK